MQEKSESTQSVSEFAARTNSLAAHYKIRVIDLPQKLNMSEDMLMGYRTGRHRITEKAWRKLEQAEIAAGIRTDPKAARFEEEQARYGLVEKPLRTAAALAYREHGLSAAGQTSFERHAAELRAMRAKAETAAGGDLIQAMRIFDDMLAAYLAALDQHRPPPSP